MRTLGLERYGILLLILGFALYAGLAEFGLGMATARFLSKTDNDEERSRILGASVVVSVPLALVAGTLFACLSLQVLAVRLGLNSSIAVELEHARLGLFFFGMSIVAASVMNGVLYGMQRFIALNLSYSLSTAMYSLGPTVYATTVGHDIAGLVSSAAIGQWIAVSVAILVCHKLRFYPKLRGVEFVLLRRLLAYGVWSTFGGSLHRATNSIDRPFIGALIGAAAIPTFAVPQSIISRSSIVIGALTGAIFPSLSKTEGTSAYDGLLIECYRSACWLAPLYIVGILGLPLFLELWIGSNFASSAANVAILLGFAGWIDALGAIPYTALLASEKISKESKLGSFIVFPNLLLLGASLLCFGIVGAAAVAIMRSTAYLVGRIFITGVKSAPLLDISSQSSLVLLTSIVAIAYPGERMLWGLLLVGISLTILVMRGGSVVEGAIERLALLRRGE